MRTRSIVAATAATGCLLAASPAIAAGQNTITVAGAASQTAANDTARVGIGIDAKRNTPGAALRVAAGRIARVLAQVRAQGIASDDIQTDEVGVHRVSQSRGRHRRPIVRYVATNSVTVTVRDVKRTGDVIDAAVAGGATSVNGPDLFLSDPEALYRKALVTAFDRAKAKAQALANQAGVTLGPPVSIQESGTQTQTPDSQSGFAGVGPTTGKAPAPTTPVKPGSTTVDASVTVVFSTS